MRVKITDRCKIWEVKDMNGYAEVKFSCSRKVKEDNNYDKILIEKEIAKNGYVSDYHSFVRFVGHAYNKLKKLEDNAAITNLDAQIYSTEPYWDSNNECVAYPKSERITVFDFELFEYNNANNVRNMDVAPQVSEEIEKEEEEENKEETLLAEDECPF